MGRYSIMVFEHGAKREVELMQVNSHPDAIVEGLRKKVLTVRGSLSGPGKKTKIPKYTFIRVVDHGESGKG